MGECKAKKSAQATWTDLLPVAAQVNLEQALKLEKIKKHIPAHEIAINLSQNVLCQEHFGVHAPVVLASSTHIWGVMRGRPYTACASWLGLGLCLL